MEVAIRSAKEVSADLYAPELYRMSVETGQMARSEYKFKNFQNAKRLADVSRIYAERAEFESIRNGGKRDALPQDPLAEPSSPAEPIATPIPGDPNAGAPPSSGSSGSPKSGSPGAGGSVPTINVPPPPPSP